MIHCQPQPHHHIKHRRHKPIWMIFLVFLLFALVLVPAAPSFASPDGYTTGTKAWGGWYFGSQVSNHNLVVDNSDATNVYACGSDNTVWGQFNKSDVTVDSYRLVGFNANTTLYLYDSAKTQIFSLSSPISNGLIQKLAAPVEHVTYWAIGGTCGYPADANFYGPQSDVTPPAAPTGLKASANLDGTITLTWTKNTEGDLYGYDIMQDGVKINGSRVATPSFQTGYLFPGDYSFTVQAVDYSGNKSPQSSQVTATPTDKTAPVAPVISSNSVGDRLATITFSASDSVDLAGYKLYVAGAINQTLDKSMTSATITGIKNAQDVDIGVSAYDVVGNESAASTVTVTPKDSIPPAKVRNVGATAGNGKAMVFFSANDEDDIKGYSLWMDGKRYNTTPDPAIYRTVSGLSNGVTYQFAVSAIDTSGNEGEVSDSVSVTPDLSADIDPPETPKNVKAETTNSSLSLTWDKNTDDTIGYFVYLNGKRATYAPITSSSFTIKNLIGGANYEIQLTAIDASGNESKKSPSIMLVIKDTVPPAKPIGLNGKDWESSAILKWQPNLERDIKGYNIWMDGVKINSAIVLSSSYTATGLTNGTTYHFAVSAVDTTGNESEKTDTIALTPKVKTPISTSTPSGDHMDITWTAVDGAIYYDIYYNSRKVDRVDGSTTSYTLTIAKGYNPASVFQSAYVVAIFPDGSTSGDPNAGKIDGGSGGTSGKGSWGFGPLNIILSGAALVVSLASFVLLSLVVRKAPELIRLIKDSAGGK